MVPPPIFPKFILGGQRQVGPQTSCKSFNIRHTISPLTKPSRHCLPLHRFMPLLQQLSWTVNSDDRSQCCLPNKMHSAAPKYTIWQAWITSSTIQSNIAIKDHKTQEKVPQKIQNTRMVGLDPAVYNRYPNKSIPVVSAHGAKPQCAKPQCAKPQSGIGVCGGSPVHGLGAGSNPFEQEP